MSNDLTCGRINCAEHKARKLVTYYCNDCGEGYTTDNDGTRTPMCDPCRKEMGYKPRAIEHEWDEEDSIFIANVQG